MSTPASTWADCSRTFDRYSSDEGNVADLEQWLKRRSGANAGRGSCFYLMGAGDVFRFEP